MVDMSRVKQQTAGGLTAADSRPCVVRAFGCRFLALRLADGYQRPLTFPFPSPDFGGGAGGTLAALVRPSLAIGHSTMNTSITLWKITVIPIAGCVLSASAYLDSRQLEKVESYTEYLHRSDLTILRYSKE